MLEQSSGAVDAITETESAKDSEQTKAESTAEPSFEDVLLKAAVDDGHVVGEQPKEEAEPETDPEETKTEETSESDDESKVEEKSDDEKEKEEQPAAKKDEWPPSAKERVAEETAKRKRANERADKAEALVAQYQAQLAQTVAPKPTEDNPFADIQDVNALDNLERSYEKTIDLADENPDGAIDVVIGRDKDGKEIRRDFTPEELVNLRKKADKAIRKFIPERKEYLGQRAIADAQAVEVYPELKDPESDFAKAAAFLANKLLSGEIQKAPDILVWIGHAVKGYQDSLKRNGNSDAQVKSPEAKRIVESAKTRVAPTPTRSRQFVERGASSANLDKVTKKFEQTGSREDAEALVGTLLSQRSGGSKRLEPIAE